MYTRRRIFSPLAVRAAIALGTVSGFVFPQVALADIPITVLGTFTGGNGNNPYSGVAVDSVGNLFGTTINGGTSSQGTVYEIKNGSNAITDLAAFNTANGSAPYGGVTLDSNGNLFGTTRDGGAHGQGVVYEVVNGSNAITDIADFSITSGVNPYSGVTLDGNGNIFGTTFYGGTNNTGTVYEILKNSKIIKSLGSFSATTGANPYAGVTFDSKGNLFGVTRNGGLNSDGAVYEIPTGQSAISLVASLDGTNGFNPYGNVAFDANDNLFGTANGGGANGTGTVYEVTKGSNVATTLVSFTGAIGADPYGGLTFDGGGNLFGTTQAGGANGQGTVFEIAKGSSTVSVLASLSLAKGINPYGTVSFDSSGNLFGTASAGGAGSDGTVYELANASPVPETSQVASLALLLTGLFLIAMSTRRHKTEDTTA